MKIETEIKANNRELASAIVQRFLETRLHQDVEVKNPVLSPRPSMRTNPHNGNDYKVFRFTFDVPEMKAHDQKLHKFISALDRAGLQVVDCPALEGTGIALSADASRVSPARRRELAKKAGYISA